MKDIMLINKLTAHLRHLADMMQNGTFRVLEPVEKLTVIADELQLMLALIKGWEKE